MLMRRLAALGLAALLASCGRPVRYRHLAPEWETVAIVASGGKIYASNAHGGIVRIDPRTLAPEALPVPGLLRTLPVESFDSDPQGLWIATRFDLGKAARVVPIVCEEETPHWTRRACVIWCGAHGARFRPRDGGFERPALPAGGDAKLLGVDAQRDRIWAVRGADLACAGLEDSAWRPARIDYRIGGMPSDERRAVDLDSVVFGARRFAFLKDGTVFVGTAETDRLVVAWSFPAPEALQSIAFNARDEDVLVGRTGESVWAWDLESGDGLRFACTSPLVYADFRGRRIVVFDGNRVYSAGPDGAPTLERKLTP